MKLRLGNTMKLRLLSNESIAEMMLPIREKDTTWQPWSVCDLAYTAEVYRRALEVAARGSVTRGLCAHYDLHTKQQEVAAEQWIHDWLAAAQAEIEAEGTT